MMKNQIFQERRASGTRLYRPQDKTFMESWQERQSTVKKKNKKAQMLMSMSKCPDSGVVGGFGSGT